MKRNLVTVTQTLTVISLIVIIFLLPLYTTIFNANTYKTQFEKHKVYDALPRYNVESINKEVLAFIQGKSEIETDFFTTREKEHLEDVKKRITVTKVLFFSSYILIIISFLVLIKAVNHRREIVKILLTAIKKASTISFGIVLVLLIASLLSFSVSFELFHKIFFKGDSYQFDPTIEKIVVLYPKQLFFEVTITILKKIVFSSVMLFFISYFLLQKFFSNKKTKKKSKKQRRKNK